MEFMNDLLEREAPSMKNFLQLISVRIFYRYNFFLLILYLIVHLNKYLYDNNAIFNFYDVNVFFNRAHCQKTPQPITRSSLTAT